MWWYLDVGAAGGGEESVVGEEEKGIDGRLVARLTSHLLRPEGGLDLRFRLDTPLKKRRERLCLRPERQCNGVPDIPEHGGVVVAAGCEKIWIAGRGRGCSDVVAVTWEFETQHFDVSNTQVEQARGACWAMSRSWSFLDKTESLESLDRLKTDQTAEEGDGSLAVGATQVPDTDRLVVRERRQPTACPRQEPHAVHCSETRQSSSGSNCL